MQYILKADPTQISNDGLVEVALPGFYGGGSVSPEDRCYLWYSEDAGGRGLTASGTVESVTRQGSLYNLVVRLDHRISTSFGIANIRAQRDDDTTPAGLIARKLYKHAHNKIAPISEAEAQPLQAHLTPNE